ncbi:putative dCTP deaminase [Erwinia phage vB_EamP_Rexella]|uniref:Putative dCTP deaminase n=1 Tax=Erwinia phage vB_EamP_Rexella TaxID=1852642 RepID=A0A1Z2XX97_9CAUD|nr:putative dCTP deaminase [Erwinia phage vB_EamP_Rexella]
MIVNAGALLHKAPIADMAETKLTEHGVSYGLSEAGYDIRIKQAITFSPANDKYQITVSEIVGDTNRVHFQKGRFTLASAMELFQMPDDLLGVVHDKSTWARHGLSVFNTVIEPGWHGYLTLELVYSGQKELFIPAGAGIAQVLFHEVMVRSHYDGKYQNQEDKPIPPRMV